MKKIITHIATAILLSITFFSCNSGELLNSEADILEVILPEGLKVGEPIITNTTVRIPKLAITPQEKSTLDKQLKELTLQFVLTPGASISNENTARDFTENQIFTVTSEDGKWKKNYDISFFNATFKKTELSFDHYEADPKYKYQKFYETDSIGAKLYVWDSGNAGYAITKKGAPAEDYPTSVTPFGQKGTGAKLMTCSTGELGTTFGMPIAAGNLFLGYFNVNIATKRPLEATEFGIQTTMKKPTKVTMWCKYKEGPEYKDKDGNVLDIKDRPEIYSVLYEAKKDESGNPIKLNGHNIRTADNIISIAALSEEQVEKIRVNNLEKDPYVSVELPFEDRLQFDPEKQENGDYYIALVFSSSAKGNLFEGAIGSTLLVDEIKFITE